MFLTKTDITPLTDDQYDLITHSYNGSGGYLDGTYLTQHDREPDTKYDKRRDLAFYFNYTRVVVDSHVKAVFAKEADRGEYTKDAVFEGFLENADALGTPLTKLMKKFATKAKAHACLLLVVDNFVDQPETVGDALDNRMYPYVYSILPKNIVDYELDVAGNMISVTYKITVVDGNGNDVEHHRTWDTMSCVTRDKHENIISSVDHNLGMLPCVFLYGTDIPDDVIIPTPEFFQVARTNKAIYNICSEIRELQRHQGFNILTIPGEPPEGKKVLGATNCLYYPADASREPQFIAPDPSPLEMLALFLDRCVQEIYRMACVTYTQQYATRESGESKKWTFHITSQVLEDFANNCEVVENKICSIFGRYIKKELNYKVTYNKNYGVDDIDQDLESALLALETGMGELGDMRVRQKAARQYFSEDGEDVVDEVVQGLEDEYNKRGQDQDADDNINDTGEDE